jgi:hypothetical protein
MTLFIVSSDRDEIGVEFLIITVIVIMTSVTATVSLRHDNGSLQRTPGEHMRACGY